MTQKIIEREARQRSPLSARKLGTLTIGQAPRSDITPILRQHVPTIQIEEAGLLDNVPDDAIQSQYGPNESEAVLVTKLLDGRPVELSAQKVRDGLQTKIDALERAGCDVILLLCTGQFHGLYCKDAWLVEPDQIIPAATSALIQDRLLGVIVPLESQINSESGKWQRLSRTPLFAAASPYHDSSAGLRAAGWSLESRGANALLLDCIGFTEEHRCELARASNLPVILSNALVAKLLGELLVS
jgi:protein AroM